MADTAGGNPGMNKLARVLQQRIKETMEDGIGDIEPDFGVIGKDGSLTTNMFPIPIPKGEYYLGRIKNKYLRRKPRRTQFRKRKPRTFSNFAKGESWRYRSCNMGKEYSCCSRCSKEIIGRRIYGRPVISGI